MIAQQLPCPYLCRSNEPLPNCVVWQSVLCDQEHTFPPWHYVSVSMYQALVQFMWLWCVGRVSAIAFRVSLGVHCSHCYAITACSRQLVYNICLCAYSAFFLLHSTCCFSLNCWMSDSLMVEFEVSVLKGISGNNNLTHFDPLKAFLPSPHTPSSLYTQ